MARRIGQLMRFHTVNLSTRSGLGVMCCRNCKFANSELSSLLANFLCYTLLTVTPGNARRSYPRLGWQAIAAVGRSLLSPILPRYTGAPALGSAGAQDGWMPLRCTSPFFGTLHVQRERRCRNDVFVTAVWRQTFRLAPAGASDEQEDEARCFSSAFQVRRVSRHGS